MRITLYEMRQQSDNYFGNWTEEDERRKTVREHLHQQEVRLSRLSAPGDGSELGNQ